MSQTSLHRSRSHPNRAAVDEELPDYAQVPELHYLALPSLADVNADIAGDQVATFDQHYAAKHRKDLQDLLQAVQDVRRGDAGQPQDDLKRWSNDIVQALKTPDHPGWNFYHKPNWESIHRFFHVLTERKAKSLFKVFSKKDKVSNFEQIVTSEGPVEEFKIDQILRNLKIDTVVRGRKQLLVNLFAHNASVLVVEDQGFNLDLSWEAEIRTAIHHSDDNFVNDHIWYRVVAVLEYVSNNVKERDSLLWEQEHLSARKRVDALGKKYPPKDVVAKMNLTPRLPGYRQKPSGHRRKRVAEFLRGGSGQSSSSAASLGHGRRLGLRQIQMRGLEPLEKAEDGGYYF